MNFNIADAVFYNYFDKHKKLIINRAISEIKYWKSKINTIKKYFHKKAIEELIIALKVDEKIFSIERYIKELNQD